MNQPGWSRHLAVRQAAVAALLGMVLGLVFGLIQASLDYGESVREEGREIDQLLNAVHDAAAQSSYNLNAPAAQGVVQGLLSFAPVHEAVILNDFGEVLAQGRNPQVDIHPTGWWTAFTQPSVNYRLTLHYGSKPASVGQLEVTVAQAPRMSRYLRGVLRSALLSVARSVFAALLLMAVFYRTLTRPLGALAAHIHAGGRGELPAGLSARHDEIGDLARAFARYDEEARDHAARLEQGAAALAASEARYRRLVDTAGEGVLQLDAGGCIRFANDTLGQMLGLPASQIIGHPWAALAVAEQREEAQALLVQRTDLTRQRPQLRLRCGDDREVRAEVAVCPVTDEEGRPAGALLMVTDATLRWQQHDELRATNARLHQMVEALEGHKRHMGEIVELNQLLQSARDEAEAFQVINAAAARMFGDRAGGLSVADAQTGEMLRVGHWGTTGHTVHADHADPKGHTDHAGPSGHPEPSSQSPWVPERYSREDCWAIRRGAPHEQSAQQGLRCAHAADGRCGSTVCLPLYVEGALLGMVHVSDGETAPGRSFDSVLRQRVDIFGEVVKLGLANLHLREHLREQALRDPLTGLPNRRMLDETLPRELSRCVRTGQVLTLAVIDVDHFKQVNDRHGHKVGDRVLQLVAAHLGGSVRAGDLCCRYGGDEFVCLLVGMSADDARRRFERVLAELAAACEANALPLRVTLTVGLATAPAAASEPGALIQAADAALYQAKALGRARVAVAAPSCAEDADAAGTSAAIPSEQAAAAGEPGSA